MKKLICMIFGHQSLYGKCGGAEYMNGVNSYVDNIGRWHLTLIANCPRCNKPYIAGKIHVPGIYMYSHSLRRVIQKRTTS